MKSPEYPNQDHAEVKVESVNLPQHAEAEINIGDRIFDLRQKINALELQVESAERSARIIKEIPILFDKSDFLRLRIGSIFWQRPVLSRLKLASM